jgi:hypothetical protein
VFVVFVAPACDHRGSCSSERGCDRFSEPGRSDGERGRLLLRRSAGLSARVPRWTSPFLATRVVLANPERHHRAIGSRSTREKAAGADGRAGCVLGRRLSARPGLVESKAGVADAGVEGRRELCRGSGATIGYRLLGVAGASFGSRTMLTIGLGRIGSERQRPQGGGSLRGRSGRGAAGRWSTLRRRGRFLPGNRGRSDFRCR